jgi:hypothetical protein
MPRKRTNEPEPEVIVLEEEPDTRDIDSILAEVGDTGSYIAIKRRNPTTKEEDYVGRYELPVDGLLERVKEEHGGGKYSGRICGKGGVYRKYITFSIDSRFRPTVVTPPTLLGATSAPPSDSGLGEVKELLKQLIALQMAPKHDPLEVGLRIAEAMRNGSSVSPVPVSSAPSITEAFAILKQGIEMGQTMSGGEGLGYLPVVEKLGGPLVEALKALANRPNAMIQKVENGGKPLMAPKPQTPEQYIQAYLPQIISLALSKKDPTLYAEVILDQVPESALDFLLDTVSRSDVIPYLTTLHPGVKEHEAWFLEFVKALKENLTPEDATLHEDIPSVEVPYIHDDPQNRVTGDSDE